MADETRREHLLPGGCGKPVALVRPTNRGRERDSHRLAACQRSQASRKSTTLLFLFLFLFLPWSRILLLLVTRS